MRNVPIGQAKASLSELASRASAGERFQLTRRGKPVAAIVGIEDLARVERGEDAGGFVRAARAFAGSAFRRAYRTLAELIPERRATPRRRALL
ncbi:MAG: type II toxin-antitoxin system prevent-host-death family antitoxin [Deltaproteobacteria bacterium]|nr:type II toxin-antitoxin system prevent-host-death family antitoxin [Deltaproteobacteria bacterium]